MTAMTAMTEQEARANGCAVCDRRISPDRLMCNAHWRLVPPAMQSAVYRTWQALCRCPSKAHFYDAVRRAYVSARDEAITTVNARLKAEETTLEGASIDRHE